MAGECITEMAVDGFHGGQIDMGAETHTSFSNDPNASMNAFLDMMLLIDAAIMRTGSSFSGMVVQIRSLRCKAVLDTVLTPRGLNVCAPPDASC